MDLRQFMRVVDATLSARGYPVSICDLPDQDFVNHFEEDYTLEEGISSANELIDQMVACGDLPDFSDLASGEFPDLLDL